MKIYTFDNTFASIPIDDPLGEWLQQFSYGYTEDIYSLYENTQDKNVKKILEHADFAVFTKNILYKRHILNEGGFMWPKNESDDWYVEVHTEKERWKFLKRALLAIPRLRLPPFGAYRAQYDDVYFIYWSDGFYFAEKDGEIAHYHPMTKEEYFKHIEELKRKGRIIHV